MFTMSHVHVQCILDDRPCMYTYIMMIDDIYNLLIKLNTQQLNIHSMYVKCK